MEINELAVHKAIIQKPQIIASKLGIELAKLDEGNLLRHHYPLSDKGEHIDFVFKDTSGVTYLAEVKLNVSPISVIPQLYDHEYKKFININSEIDPRKIIPVIVLDKDSVTSQDFVIFEKMNIKLCTYDLEEIEAALRESQILYTESPVSFEFPEYGAIEDFLKHVRNLQENFGDINFLLDGFRGNDWWDGYFDFRTFWLWKENKYPEIHQAIFKLLCQGKKEDCIWFTFLTAISDNFDVAKHIILKEKWDWSKTISAGKKEEIWQEFENCLCNSGRWGIQNLLDFKKRKQVVHDYLEKTGDGQEAYFLNLISNSDNPFDAYNQVWNTIHAINNIGNVVAGEFATYLSQWRILPIIPSDQVRESQFVKKALDTLGIRKPMESYRDAMLRLAKKYFVSPIVIERAMHKLGRFDNNS